jgi:hypothetical protein
VSASAIGTAGAHDELVGIENSNPGIRRKVVTGDVTDMILNLDLTDHDDKHLLIESRYRLQLAGKKDGARKPHAQRIMGYIESREDGATTGLATFSTSSSPPNRIIRLRFKQI